MKRKLEEIIKEINEMSDIEILKSIDGKDFDIEDYTENEKKYFSDRARENAINFITKKYKELDESDVVTDRDYEIADFKTFEKYFNLIKDRKEKIKIDKELYAKERAFFDRLSNTTKEEIQITEERDLKIITNKDGHGTTNYKICLPAKWVKDMNTQNVTLVYDYYTKTITLTDVEVHKFNKMLEELRAELQKEKTLLDLDIIAQTILKSDNSLFDNEEESIKYNHFIYTTETNKKIQIIWEILNKKEDNFKTLVKVVDIHQMR